MGSTSAAGVVIVRKLDHASRTLGASFALGPALARKSPIKNWKTRSELTATQNTEDEDRARTGPRETARKLALPATMRITMPSTSVSRSASTMGAVRATATPCV